MQSLTNNGWGLCPFCFIHSCSTNVQPFQSAVYTGLEIELGLMTDGEKAALEQGFRDSCTPHTVRSLAGLVIRQTSPSVRRVRLLSFNFPSFFRQCPHLSWMRRLFSSHDGYQVGRWQLWTNVLQPSPARCWHRFAKCHK